MTPRELAKRLDITCEYGMTHDDVLAAHYRKMGKEDVHLCPDWDFMAIHRDSPEYEACTCEKQKHP